MSENFSKTLNDSLTDTTSHFNSRSTSRSHGTSFGFLGIGFNNSTSTGYSSGSSWASAVTRGTSETKGETVTETDTDTTGDSRTITVTSENKSVKYILEKIDQHLARIKNCEAFGLWDIACYFVSENVQTSVVAASTYKALMAGFDSGVENSYVNVWKQDNTENTPALLEYLRYCIHPRFSIPGDDQFFEVESQTVNPCSLISGNEMPYIMGLPHHSVPGVTVLNMAEFGRNVRFSSGAPRGKKVELGQVYHMGEKETARVKLNLESFRSHCFITGSTGSGKSNTTYRILDEMIEHKIPFLVVEPAKGEYKRYYGKLPGIHVYCTNPRYYSMLHINPFRFNQGIHVLEHLDRLIEIFNACWPLYAAMPAILKESFERAYIKCGWDLENSIYIPNGHSKFPTFNDVLEALPEIINSSSYSSDSKGDYTGALVTRVKSLTNGISGQVLCSVNDIDEEYLFDQNTIVDLSRVSSLETKSLLMGVLILKLNEYRMCTSEENQPLRHVTVMEEAHNILKRSPTGGSEGSNVQAKSVEMISSAIAEMRTYGEGFIIVDQSPTAVDVSAVKNTNTKIIMRLPDYEDCKIAGLSMGLNDSQIREISRFPMGVAVVYQNNWVEAVLTQIDKSEEQYHQTDLITDDYALAVIKGQLAVELVFQYETGLAAEEGFQLDDLLEIINSSDINASKKQDIVQSMVDWCSCFEREAPVNGSFAAKLAEFISCNGLFEALPIRFAKDYKNEPKITRDCIDKKDLASIRNWHSRVYDHLDSYVLLTDENIKNRVLRYLLLNKRVEEINYNKYQLKAGLPTKDSTRFEKIIDQEEVQGKMDEKITTPVEEVAEPQQTPAETPAEQTALLEKLDAVQQALAALQQTFDDKIAEDTHKNGLFDNMHRELVRYQNGALDKIVDTIALDIIQLVDSTKGHVRVYEKKEPTEENYKKLLKETGKSNYVAVLINQLKNDIGRAFNCALMACGDKTLNRYRTEFYDPLYRHRTCVRGSDAGDVDPLIYSLIFQRKGGLFKKAVNDAVSLTFFDTAGENLNSLASMQTFNRYLYHSSGIILLLDPLQLPAVRDELQGKIRLPEENTDVNTILNRTIEIIRTGSGLTDLSMPYI